ncbi:MAG: T9SS type A sorting domain-containing protein [Bacteroidetes bacterium]|nr:T9SS type A sorting domain-containing protein [Bacteroidota bacterium]
MKSFQITFYLFCFLGNIFSQQVSVAQWSQSGNLSNLVGYPFISVADSNVVWIAGGTSNPVVYRTVNGGVNWTSIPVTGLPFVLSGVAAKDSLTAFVCDYAGDPQNGGNAKVFKTTNAGNSWTLVDSTGGLAGYFNGIQFSKSNPQFGIAFSDPPDGGGNPFFLLKTTNGGSNWIRQSPPGVTQSYGYFHSLFTIDPLFYGFLTFSFNSGSVKPYITNNGGLNWQLSQVSIPNNILSDVVFSDNKQTGIMVGGNIPKISRTTNAGVTWDTVNTNSQISGYAGACWISGTNTVFINSESNTNDNTILRSDDGGVTWSPQTTANTTGLVEIDYARYNNVIVAYCVSEIGDIIKTRQSVQPVGISQLSNTIPEKFTIKQNYPNPFNPETKINYELEITNYVTLVVYDVLGNELKTLVNNKQNAGSYSVNFDGAGLPSGVYFYKLSVDGFAETKSMVLLK